MARILVVDDTPNNLVLCQFILESLGHECLTAADGHEALQMLNTETPDLILLDVMMPGIDGYQTCRLIRMHHACARTPVIFLSALDEVRDRNLGRLAGGTDYLTKPVDDQLLAEALAIHLRTSASATR